MLFSEKYPHLQRIDVSHFSLNKITNTFVTEASEVRYNAHRRVYSDACDAGLVITNDKKGTDILVTLLREEKAGEDVVAWIFVASHEVTIPKVHDYEFVILND